MKVGSSFPEVTGSGTLFWKLVSPPSELMGKVDVNTRGLLLIDGQPPSTAAPVRRRVANTKGQEVPVARDRYGSPNTATKAEGW